MGIAELFEMGLFTIFWNWSDPILTAIVYAFVIVGVIIQIILQKKCRKPKTKWLLMGICGVGIVICECLYQVITGWDRLAIDIIYGLVICLLLGAIITTIISALKNRH
jgi:hypothetical protein